MTKILVTNARSLSPKIESLQNMFESYHLDVALVTESWLRDSQLLDADVVDLEHGTGLKIIYKNRPKKNASRRSVGGGVSIVYSKARCSFKERRIAGNKFELVAAVGRIGRLQRQVAIFCVYLEPKLRVADLASLNELIADEILQLKAKGDPLIYIGGDMNRKSLDPAFHDYHDIKQANFDPTRGGVCLDIMFTNANNVSSTVLPPLTSRTGTSSDHACVLVAAEEPRVRNFTWIKKTTRTHSDKAVKEFGRRMRSTDWDAVLPEALDPDRLVDAYQAYTTKIMDELFPYKTVRCRSNEDPWVTNGARTLAKRKRRMFRREGKSMRWVRLRDLLEQRLSQSKETYVDKVASGGTSTRAYFKAVKKLGTVAPAPDWNLLDLFPGNTAEEACNYTAGYFTRITDQFDPLPPTRTSAPSRRRPITEAEVEKKLKAAKKPNSTVRGDILPRLMKEHYTSLVKPITRIFNAVFSTNSWPEAWKEETTVVIPKIPNPSSLGDCRNISCTPFLSKVLESILLEDLRSEIPVDEVQYGGIKDCSVNHLLIDLYDSILENLEEGNPSVLVGIDYEKAFNRLDHKNCLDQLRKLGASEPSLALARSFLTRRSMRVRLGPTLSSPKFLKGGSPQGSILGCLLYCIATQQIGPELANTRREMVTRPQTSPGPEQSPTPSQYESPEPPHEDHVREAETGFRVEDWAVPGDHQGTASSPDSFYTAEDSIPDRDQSIGPWEEYQLVEMFKYVDDTTLLEPCDKERCVRYIAASNPTEVIVAEATSVAMANIVEKTDQIGMRVNAAKTQMVCISTNNGYCTSATLAVGNALVKSQPSVKLLGFVIDACPGVSGQVGLIRDKFRARFWTLIHLRRAGIRGRRLFKLYAALVRPVLEANSVVYHTMLTKAQADELEGMQRRVIRLCFGFATSADNIARDLGIGSLKARRENAVLKFTRKAMATERFARKWFIEREEVETSIRKRRPFIEKRARTERFLKSPLIHLQKTANDIMTATNNANANE